jgi:polysaccharide biosynthesis protein PslH
MNILWISQNLPYPPKTGVLQRNYNLLREAAQFADVHLVAIVKEDILPGFDEELATRELGEFCASVEAVRIPIERSRSLFLATAFKSIFTAKPFTVNWAASSDLFSAIARAASATHYDAVYFDTISLAEYRGIFGGTRLALNHHNIESHLFARRLAYEVSPLKRIYFALEARKLRRYEHKVAGDFDVHLVVSELDAERLRDIRQGANTHVVANGVDVDFFRASGRLRQRGHLVMISGMNWFPNRDAVLYMVNSIWPAVASSVPHATLTIVGASPPEAVVDLAVRDPRVSVTGFVQDVRPYMERAQVYLCPMRDGGGTRLKILDALAMGMPIVSTSMALEGIPVSNECEVLVAESPDEFARQIGRLVADEALCSRLSTNGRAFVERHFAWPVIGRQLRAALTGDKRLDT